MTWRVRVACGAVVAVLTACSGGGERTSYSAQRASSPPPSPAERPAPAGEPAGDDGWFMVDAVDLTDAVPGGRTAVIDDGAVTADGRGVVVGAVRDPGGDAVWPYVLEQTETADWTPAMLPLGEFAGGAATSAAASEAGIVVGGWVDDGTPRSQPAVWLWRNGVWEGPHLTGLPPDTTIIDVGAGPAGHVAVGMIGGVPAAWYSGTGRAWTPIEPAPPTVPIDVTVGGSNAIVRTSEGGATVLAGPAAGPWEPVVVAAGADITATVAIGPELHAFGGIADPAGELVPAMWRSSDGRVWEPSATVLPAGGGAASSAGLAPQWASSSREQAVVVSNSGSAWVSRDAGASWQVLPDGAPLRPRFVLATATPVVGTQAELYRAGADGWAAVPGWLPPADTSMLTAVAEHDGVWYAFGTRRFADGSGATLVLRSTDASTWELIEPDAELGVTIPADADAWAGGLVLVGSSAPVDDRGGRVLRSTDGRRWQALAGDSLLATGDEILQPESVGVAPGGSALVAGYDFDGEDIRPMALRVGDLTVEPSTGLDAPAGEAPTLAVCVGDSSALLLGGSDADAADGWAASGVDDPRWDPIDLGEGGDEAQCDADGERFAVVTSRHDRGLDVRIGALDALDAVDVRGPSTVRWVPEDVAYDGERVLAVGRTDRDLSEPGFLVIGTASGTLATFVPGAGRGAAAAVAVVGDRAVLVGERLGRAAIWTVMLS